jgi:AcrR family transcriptional regulator
MSLREQKKEETRKKLLDSARSAFAERGYAAAKTSDIAKAVGIAEGTLFNYFPTKAELFLAAMLPASAPTPAAAPTAAERDASAQDSWAESLVGIANGRLAGLAAMEKALQREFMALFYAARPAEVAGLSAFDRGLEEDVAAFFAARKEASPDKLRTLDPALAAECVCGLTMSAYAVYLMEETLSYDGMLERLRRQLAFALQAWS